MEQPEKLLHKPIGLQKITNFRIVDMAEKVKKKRGFFPVCNSIKGINFRTGIRNAISEKDYTDKK